MMIGRDEAAETAAAAREAAQAARLLAAKVERDAKQRAWLMRLIAVAVVIILAMTYALLSGRSTSRATQRTILDCVQPSTPTVTHACYDRQVTEHAERRAFLVDAFKCLPAGSDFRACIDAADRAH